ncbi:hypothetical protein EKH57_10490 [Halorubrum sp. BOL3-1]|uniref:DUF7322 domain-containing protein n=1 Tax=Halorubrum sp. BOL3-1 TaxID=2497325 RepID=UPI001004DE69|nr:hypothetical protein [Halorubrum sp. BOL3-1]QAU13112.1 hypothetical protein EKH57_10490 [Halorubrum sp. BOL3-1]
MFSLDEDDEGEVPFGESSEAEQEMTPDIPEAPSVKTFDDGEDFGATSDVDQDTLRAFVVAVIYANAALLLVALGPMVWFFEGRPRIGTALFVGGLLAGVRTYQTHRSWKRSRDDADGPRVDRETDESDSDVETDETEPDPDSPPEA